MEQSQSPFTNFDIVDYLCQFLRLRDKLALGSTNRRVGHMISEHLKLFMKQNDLPKIHDRTSRQMIKFYMNRNIRAVRIPTLMHHSKQESTHYNFLRGKLIVKIDAGKNFAIFKDNIHNVYYTKSAMLTSKYNPAIKFQTANNVKKAFGKGSRMFLLFNDGTVTATQRAEGAGEVAGPSELIEWTKRVPVQDMAVSYNFAIFVLGAIKISDIKKRIFLEEFDQDVALEQARGKWVKILSLNLLTGKYTIIKYPLEDLKSFCVGSSIAYFVDGKNKLFQCELNNINEGQKDISVNEVAAFENKSVVRVWSGFHYYIALCRSEYLLDKWDNARVLEWLKKEGFTDFSNIMKVEKVDGRRLLDMDKKYMTDVLGITNANLQQKMLLSIVQNQQISYAGDELFGWGRNDAGQLGNSMAQFVQKPVKIKLPEFAKNQYIEDICCGWLNTMIKTNTCRLFISVLSGEHEKEAPKPPKEEQISDQELKKQIQKEKKQRRKKSEPEEDFRRDIKEDKKKKKESAEGSKKKDIVEGSKKKSHQDKKDKEDKHFIEKHHEKYEEQSKWIEYKSTKPFVLDSAKDILIFTQLAFKEEDYKKKVRTAKAAIDKVVWDPNIDTNEFTVGYFDKYMGTLETPIAEYQKSEIKEHRLLYLKRAGTIVWHREDKIDLL